MKTYIVYKLFDKNGKVVWIGSTFYPINRRLDQHKRLYGMEFADHEVLGTFSTQKEAMLEEDRLLKKCIDADGELPHYVKRAYCPF